MMPQRDPLPNYFLPCPRSPHYSNLIMAPALGATAFASVMAFETGGIVPGVTDGDSVPAMLTPVRPCYQGA